MWKTPASFRCSPACRNAGIMGSLPRMSNRIDTLEATLAALKRLEKKGVRSVYLEGIELESATPLPAATPGPAAAAKPGAPSPVATAPARASAATAPATTASPETIAGLAALAKTVSVCTRCALHSSRTQTVFGVGNPHAKLMFIGEAPGADEDAKGEPFVGRAGQLLDKMLVAIGFPREEVFIANILKSRPPGNRDPLPTEVAACEPYLWKQIELIRPKMILCMGRIAGTNLLKNGIDTLAKLRGNVYDYMGAKVMVTYHPAALLRNPNWKSPAWEDLQKFRRLYDELVGDKPKFDP